MDNTREKILNLPNIPACVEVWSVDSRICFFLVGSGRQFNKCTQLCTIVLESSPSTSRTSPSPRKHPFCFFVVSLLPGPQLLTTTNLFPDLMVLSFACKWDHPECRSLTLLSLMHVRSSMLYMSVVLWIRLQLVSCSLYVPLFLDPSSTGRALELFLGHIFPRVSKCAQNRRSDSSLGKAVCGLGSPDSASECEVTWKTNWQLAVKSKTHVQPQALVHLGIHSSCSVYPLSIL